MTDPELIRRAEAAGITTSYENWQRQRVDVPPATLEAILAALAHSSPAAPAPRPAGPAAGAAPTAPAAPVRWPVPPRPASLRLVLGALAWRAVRRCPSERSWGFTVQLYSVRSGSRGATATCATWPSWPGLERPRSRGRVRAGQPAARGRARPAGQPVAVPADDPAVRQPALPADRGHPRVRRRCRRRSGPTSSAWPRRCGRPAPGRRPDRPGRGVDGQAGRPGAHLPGRR